MNAQDRRTIVAKIRVAGYSDNPDEPYAALNPINRQALVDYLFAVQELSPSKRGAISIVMPCGRDKNFTTTADLPYEALPCSCGRADHYFIKYSKDPLGLNELAHIS